MEQIYRDRILKVTADMKEESTKSLSALLESCVATAKAFDQIEELRDIIGAVHGRFHWMYDDVTKKDIPFLEEWRKCIQNDILPDIREYYGDALDQVSTIIGREGTHRNRKYAGGTNKLSHHILLTLKETQDIQRSFYEGILYMIDSYLDYLRSGKDDDSVLDEKG